MWLTAVVLADETVWAVPCPSLTPTLWPQEWVSPSLTPWLTPSLTLWAVESERPLCDPTELANAAVSGTAKLKPMFRLPR